MILVFDMALSLWASMMAPTSKQRVFDSIPAYGLDCDKFSNGSRLAPQPY
jgi:hypothetical protein